jgi:hypothetical protein
MPNLKAVEFGFNKFCGPSVLSILTGRSTDECARVISKINGHYNVTGVLLSDLLKAANKLGYQTADMGYSGSSLFMVLHRIAPYGNAQYIVTLQNHFVCIEVADGKMYFCDNHTKEPIPAASSARLSTQVVNIHRVVRDPNFVEPVIKVKPVFLRVTYLMCPECSEIGEDASSIGHSLSCKWRDYVETDD